MFPIDSRASRAVLSGMLLATGTALISGISVFAAKFGSQAIPDPFVHATARNLYVGAILLALTAVQLLAGRRREPLDRPPLHRKDRARLLSIAVVGGSVPFLLFFWGLTMTSAPLASLIQKTQFLWVAALAVPLLGEAFGAWQALGLLALLAGTLVLGPVPLKGLGAGEALVVAATLLWSVEAVLVRATVRTVPPLHAAAARMAGGAVVMLAFLIVSGRLPALLALTTTQWWWVVLPGTLLLGYVLTWYHALRAAPATVVTSILTLGAPITAALSAAWVAQPLAPAQLPSTAFLVAGGAALTYGAWRASRRTLQLRSLPHVA